MNNADIKVGSFVVKKNDPSNQVMQITNISKDGIECKWTDEKIEKKDCFAEADVQLAPQKSTAPCTFDPSTRFMHEFGGKKTSISEIRRRMGEE